MPVEDVSEFNSGLSADCTGALIRLSHGPTVDRLAQEHVTQARDRRLPFGFYSVPESNNPRQEAGTPKSLLSQPWTFGFTLGFWCDFAVGDLPNGMKPSTPFFDTYRAILDSGLYVNKAALNLMPEYARYERLWTAGTASNFARWLLNQPGGLDSGDDIDIAADLFTPTSPEVRPQWAAFTWPNP